MLLKQITVIGAPQVLSALIPLAKVQTQGKGEEERGEMDLSQWYVLVGIASLLPARALNSSPILYRAET